MKLDETIARSGPAGRRVPGRAGLCRHRPAADAPPGDPQGLAHRRGGHRQGGHGRCGRHAQAGDARARRQVAADHLRGCRSGERGRRRAARQFLFRRRSLLERYARVRAREHPRALSRAAARARVRRMRVGDPMDPADPGRRADLADHMEKVLGYIARGRAEGARLLVGRPSRRRVATWPAATSSRRRCSTIATTTWPSCARRSSARSCRC